MPINFSCRGLDNVPHGRKSHWFHGGKITVSRFGLTMTVVAALALAGTIATEKPAFATNCQDFPSPGVDWQDCQKRSIILKGLDLTGAKFERADLSSTDFRETTLKSADFIKSYLVRAAFDRSTAPGANFEKALGYRTSFVGADLDGANFTSAEMQRADFSGANLANVSFAKSELGRADFTGANLTGTDFTHANLARTDFRKALFDGSITFTGAHLFLTRFEGVNLSEAIGLAQWQIDMSCGDEKTKLPKNLSPGAGWPCEFDD